MINKYKKDDIVEVSFPEGHRNFSWNGLRFKMTEVKTVGPNHVRGKVVAPPHEKLTVGCHVVWNFKNLILVQPEKEKDEKYFSPFSGEWV